VAQEKGHLTTEQLSTLLDREGLAEEQAQWEAHLSTCPQCQQGLAGLRQTVALLHALPQPALPRSFALPLEVAEPVAIPQAAAPTPIRQAKRRTLNPYVRGVLRTMSALAAVIGVVFFLSGVLPSLSIHGGGTASGTASSGYSAHPQAASSAHTVTNAPTATSAQTTPKADSTTQATPAATQVVKPQTTSGTVQANPSSGPRFFIFDLSTQAGRVGFGMLLVILGLMGFVLFRTSSRRARS